MEPSVAATQLAAMAQQAPPPYKAARVNADDMRRRAMKLLGEPRYWAEEAQSWEQFRREGIKGLGVTWGEGMQDVIKGLDEERRTFLDEEFCTL
ncbi:hypothetical protein NUW58_g3179 [Xylaria curta]|uniref:Uncharacterized protein n=1 Tax=Xylaria curta TaxID=42375 RepID=A0ACC1PD48_9PEZI|nr:hypothetical protein NUW58_g3179 [Xylaria curta]